MATKAMAVMIKPSPLSSQVASVGISRDEEQGQRPMQQQLQLQKDEETNENVDSPAIYSVFTRMRRYIGFAVSWAALFSPLSSNIYFPVLNTLASELTVSTSMINLTLTSYMVRIIGIVHNTAMSLFNLLSVTRPVLNCYTRYSKASPRCS